MQQGYSASGQKDYGGQLAAIQALNADIIALQESDAARIAGGNSDLVAFIANGLGFYSYYGPKTVTGTFGIALLSRYPIDNPRTWYLYSEGEQVAAIEATITINARTWRVFVTHLGNGGPMIQQQQFLDMIGDAKDVIALGDFNFRTSTEQYALTTTALQDAWAARWPEGADDSGSQPVGRIDYVFVSPECPGGGCPLRARPSFRPSRCHGLAG